MQYGDKLETSKKSLPELLSLSQTDLYSMFGMKRGHIARFVDRTTACTDPLPASYTIHARKRATSIITSRSNSIYNKSQPSFNSRKSDEQSVEQSMADIKLSDGHIFKGIVAFKPAEPRACGCVQPPPVVDSVAPYSAIENISVQKLTPEYKTGMQRLVKAKTPPMKASDLWKDKPAVLLCIRRPG